MEPTTGQRLIDNFNILKNEWPFSEISKINGADLYYTDGMAADAMFKIQFYQGEFYITTVYIKEDGTYYLTVDNIAIKLAIKNWIDNVKDQTK